jgi:membrane protein implicated in regulation of membrane protease activity
VIFVKDMLYAVLALVSAVGAVFCWLQYTGSANTLFLVVFVILVVATIALGAVFLSGRVNKREDIHITE